MKETEDQRIADKFRQVFENFEDPASNEGWLELRKKYPEEKRRPLFFWISSAAALLILLSGLWLYIPEIDHEFIAVKNSPATDQKETNPQTKREDTKQIIPAPALSEDLNISSDKNLTTLNQSAFPEEKKAHFTHSGDDSNIAEKSVMLTIDSVSSPEYAISEPTKTQDELSIKPDTISQASAPIAKTGQYLRPESEELKRPEEKGGKSEKSRRKSFSLSVYAGSFINYSKGSENNVNIGAGLSSDFRISKNLRISTGLNLSKNSLVYNQNEPGNSYGSFQDVNASAIGNLVALSNYEAELLGLDIPVNVKYLFNPEKSSTYFLAGLSSGTYLSEKYAVKQSNFNSFVGSSAAANKQEISRQMQDFDLMRTLNLSFGFNTRLSKKQSLTIEPFLKYPLGGLGSENIRFGSSGINVKLNFNTLKKP